MTEDTTSAAAKVGGTAIAFVVSLIAIALVSTVVAVLFGMLQYYVGNMRFEAAVVIGQIVGGAVSVYAARYACDATIRQFSHRAVFIGLALLIAIGVMFQISQGWSIETVSRLASVLAMAGASWFVFWKNDY